MRRRGAAEIPVRIKHGKQCQADARLGCGRGDAFRQLRDIGVRLPGGIVMQIVKFAHARETALQHLDIGKRCDGFDFLRRQPVEEAIHDFAPGPEIVAFRSARFGQSRHAALKGVAVDIAKARDRDSVTLVAGLGLQYSPQSPRSARPAR